MLPYKALELMLTYRGPRLSVARPSRAAAQLGSLLLALATICGCVPAPTRSDTDSFFILTEGRIAPASTTAFAACLLEGFDKAHFMITNSTSRQHRLLDSYRVETLAGGRIIVVSADIFDNGRVVLNESKSGTLINTTGEREAFDRCLSKFGSTR